METAIKKAIEGGYMSVGYDHPTFLQLDPVVPSFHYTAVNGDHEWKDINDVLLDPLFWQSLGKILGWGETKLLGALWPTADWINNWHRLITALSEGQSPDDFFNTLLSGTDLVS